MRNRGRLSASYDWTRSFNLPHGIQSTWIKTVICPAPPLRFEQMPDIIIFRDCIAISFPSQPFSCFPRFPLWCRSEKYGIFYFNVVLWFSCILERPIFIWCVSEPCGFVVFTCQNKRVAKGYSFSITPTVNGESFTNMIIAILIENHSPAFLPYSKGAYNAVMNGWTRRN